MNTYDSSWGVIGPGNCPNWDIMFRLIVLGDADVGKSCLVRSFVEGNYKPTDSTVGVDFSFKVIPLVSAPRDCTVKLQIWDTAGAERFRAITHAYYRNTAGVVLTFDVTSRPSFAGIPTWVQQIHMHTGNPNVTIVLVGTKIDMPHRRVVSSDEALTLAQQLKLQYMEVSAKELINVGRTFSFLSSAIYQKYEQGLLSRNSDISGVSFNSNSLSFDLSGSLDSRIHKVCLDKSRDEIGDSCCSGFRSTNTKPAQRLHNSTAKPI